MQFTQVTVLVSAVEVINTVRDVEVCCISARKHPGLMLWIRPVGQEEYTSNRLYVIFVEGITNRIVFNHVGIFCGVIVFFRPEVQVCLSAGIVDDIPFCFTHRLVALHGQFIVRGVPE